tara:strand:- start:33 stop:644 length:612 start_codon:yes stop_codon:yes gene_type:complete
MHGEDLIIQKYFKDKKNGLYVDLGCYHPIQYNNTLLLYQNGWEGINVDINKFSIKLFDFCRPKDINLNIAVSNKNSEIDFYFQKKLSLLSTIIKTQSDVAFQGKIKKSKILSQTLTKILDNSKYKNRKIDFLDLDIEGADLEALESLDFSRYEPEMICAEIVDKNQPINDDNLKNSNIYKFLIAKSYSKIWSGMFNHIFVIKK